MLPRISTAFEKSVVRFITDQSTSCFEPFEHSRSFRPIVQPGEMSCAFNRILGANLRACRRVWGGHESKEGHERGRDPRKNTEAERHTKSCGRFRRNSPDFTEARAIWHRVVFHFAGHELVRCNLKVDPAFRRVRHELRPTLWWCGTAPSENLRLVHGAIRDENG